MSGPWSVYFNPPEHSSWVKGLPPQQKELVSKETTVCILEIITSRKCFPQERGRSERRSFFLSHDVTRK